MLGGSSDAPSYSRHRAVCGGEGRPQTTLLTPGQISDYEAATRVFGHLLPDTTPLIGDSEDDADWPREDLRLRALPA